MHENDPVVEVIETIRIFMDAQIEHDRGLVQSILDDNRRLLDENYRLRQIIGAIREADAAREHAYSLLNGTYRGSM